MADPIERIVDLFEVDGAHRYGLEEVSQLEHALQCATLAMEEGAPEPLMAACLLHDLGHLVHDLPEGAAADGIDDRHQYRALHLLRRLYADEVIMPVRLHVEAKRYLCATRPGYSGSLSEASRRTLALQGGAHTAQQAARFIEQPYARDAVQLRLWDDRAKTPGARTPRLAFFVNVLERCIQ